uniref:Uncharacterized protein n=1 Tax=Romanomermis culicivorax TaxID=13658 RepID=A0A915KQ74_ROMCU
MGTVLPQPTFNSLPMTILPTKRLVCVFREAFEKLKFHKVIKTKEHILMLINNITLGLKLETNKLVVLGSFSYDPMYGLSNDGAILSNKTSFSVPRRSFTREEFKENLVQGFFCQNHQSGEKMVGGRNNVKTTMPSPRKQPLGLGLGSGLGLKQCEEEIKGENGKGAKRRNFLAFSAPKSSKNQENLRLNSQKLCANWHKQIFLCRKPCFGTKNTAAAE